MYKVTLGCEGCKQWLYFVTNCVLLFIFYIYLGSVPNHLVVSAPERFFLVSRSELERTNQWVAGGFEPTVGDPYSPYWNSQANSPTLYLQTY